jgi:[ribosomal protein S5]-alanine N-acetyltransferase
MELKTQRLWLREFDDRDTEALFAIYSEAENRRYENGPLTRAESDQKLGLILADQKANPRSHYHLAITLPPTTEANGWIALTLTRAEVREYEIGWTVRTPLWGNGYASEAARAGMDYAFAQLNAHRLIAFCHADNRRSMRVMEKLGMQAEALLRESNQFNGTWYDERIYAILEREFLAQPASKPNSLEV